MLRCVATPRFRQGLLRGASSNFARMGHCVLRAPHVATPPYGEGLLRALRSN